jgi:enoyl-CoA hydratase/carnithine racemase
MIVSVPDEDPPLVQNNFGDGVLVGRDNYGPIEMVDTKTKAVLAKISRDAPALGRLLSKALRDGVISPDAVSALAFAARNINEDVASALLTASRHIDHDVASSLALAGRNINQETVMKIGRASRNFAESVARFEETAERLVPAIGRGPIDRLAGVVEDLSDAGENADYLPPVSEGYFSSDSRRVRNAFLWGFLVGVMIATIAVVGGEYWATH